MIRAVLDANILVSAAIKPKGKPAQVIARAGSGFAWLISEYILAETAAVLNRKHIQARYGKWVTLEHQVRFLAAARGIAELVEVHTQLKVVPNDVKDNPILACAVDGQAEYLVSGDPHLTKLGEFAGIKIVTPDQLIVVLESLD